MISSTLYVLYPFSDRNSDTLGDLLTCPTEPWPGSKWYSCASHSQGCLTLEPVLLIAFLCCVQQQQLCHMWPAEPRSGLTLVVKGLTLALRPGGHSWLTEHRAVEAPAFLTVCSVAHPLLHGYSKEPL